jgi:endonuclease/exonuclease/phosphatase family metal-dependent hydrolase
MASSGQYLSIFGPLLLNRNPIMRKQKCPLSIREMIIGIALVLPLCAEADCDKAGAERPVLESDLLRVATLNMAHGRKDSFNQMFLKDEDIRSNLEDIAALLERVEPHVIALQEADAPSSWSGKFDHVDVVASEAGFPCSLHGVHASNRIYDFGTALVSKHQLRDTYTHNFPPSKPTTTKGFVAGTISWNPDGKLDEPVQVRIVSVHLDFSRKKVRKQQTDELADKLSQWNGPLIIMGDFNTDWKKKESSLKKLAERLDMKVFKPLAEDLGTYHKKGSRLDWILLSGDISFNTYAVVPDVVSDHMLVVADIQLGIVSSDTDPEDATGADKP